MITIGNDIGLNTNAIVVCEIIDEITEGTENKLKIIDYYFQDLSKKELKRQISDGNKFKILDDQYKKIFNTYSKYDLIYCYEKPIMNGKVGGDLNGVVALLKMNLYEFKVPEDRIIPVNPQTLKKDITGYGNCVKKDMLFNIKQKEDILNNVA